LTLGEILKSEIIKNCAICKGYLALSMDSPWRGEPTVEQKKEHEVKRRREYDEYKRKHLQHLKDHGLVK
jgi:hypothetical protein